jgi:O-antigen/teichoic acid export membrane protein
LARTGDLSALGGYGIAYRISTGLGIFVVGFGVAWQPYLYRSEASSVQDRARRIAPLVMAAIGAAAVVITALANEIVHLVAGDRYVAAIVAVPALTGGMVALALFTLLSTVSGVLYGTGRVGLLAIVGTAVQAGLALVLVPAFGLTGAALASALGYGVSAVLLAASVGFVRLDRSGIALIVVSALVVGGLVVGQSIGSADLLIRASLAGAVTCVAALALWRSSSGLAGRDD